MKIKWPGIIFTIALYAAMLAALLITDNLPKRGANDMSTGLMVAAISFLIIAFFFFRSIYQALKIDRSFWVITITHLICIVLVYLYLAF